MILKKRRYVDSQLTYMCHPEMLVLTVWPSAETLVWRGAPSTAGKGSSHLLALVSLSLG